MDVQASLVGRKCANILPSPPESPESPSTYACPPASGCYNTRMDSGHVLRTPSVTPNVTPTESIRQACDMNATASQSQENSLDCRITPVHSSNLHQMATIQNSISVCSDKTNLELPVLDQTSDHIQQGDSQKPRPMTVSNIPSEPPSQLVSMEIEHQSGGDEMLTGSEEEEVEADKMIHGKTSAERLAEKRKMKRFRLTHAQTRYLTSEFSRQPHPDAAQRERLSRDIPGLNPRQVQVWFQNRRAKLKRLTTDDQERMRKARTLPDDFNFSPTLQRSLREGRPFYSSALTEPLMLGGSTSPKPSLRLGMDHVSPVVSGINSSFTNHFPSPISATGSANPSPITSVSEGSKALDPRFSDTQTPYVTGPQFSNPFGRFTNLSTGYAGFSRQGRPCNQNSAMGLAASPSNLSVANNNYGYGCLPPLKYAGSSFQARNDQNFGRLQISEAPSFKNGAEVTQHYVSPVCSQNTMSYEQPPMLNPGSSGLPTPSYCQSSETDSWREGQVRTQGYQCGEQLQPLQISEHRQESESTQCALPQGAPVSRHDQRSYSLSGERYCGLNSPIDHQAPQTMLGAKATTCRPRARSDTFPIYHSTQ